MSSMSITPDEMRATLSQFAADVAARGESSALPREDGESVEHYWRRRLAWEISKLTGMIESRREVGGERSKALITMYDKMIKERELFYVKYIEPRVRRA